MATISELIQGKCSSDAAESAAAKNNALMEAEHWEQQARNLRRVGNEAKRKKEMLMHKQHVEGLDVMASIAKVHKAMKGAYAEAMRYQTDANRARRIAQSL